MTVEVGVKPLWWCFGVVGSALVWCAAQAGVDGGEVSAGEAGCSRCSLVGASGVVNSVCFLGCGLPGLVDLYLCVCVSRASVGCVGGIVLIGFVSWFFSLPSAELRGATIFAQYKRLSLSCYDSITSGIVRCV